MSTTWMSNGCLRAAPTGEVDAGKGIIGGVSVCTVGEAKGHDLNLDSEFIDTVARFGNEKTQGLKARFGHPNMCSTALGTFLGRFKNFSVVGDQVVADLFLSNSAKETPNGDLHAYVLNMAEENPDMFGTSIVFSPGRTFRKDVDTGENVFAAAEHDHEGILSDDVFVECEALHACDTVDEPAANEGGLFSKFAHETAAGQITEFLDMNPEVWGALEENPDILKSLSEHGEKMDEFMNRYRDYREHNGGHNMSDKKAQASAEAEALASQEAEAKQLEEETAAAELAANEEAEALALAETEAAEKLAAELETNGELSREDFLRIDSEFGSDVAAQTVRDGGTYASALLASHEALKADNAALNVKIEELSAPAGGTAAKVVSESKKSGSLFKTGK